MNDVRSEQIEAGRRMARADNSYHNDTSRRRISLPAGKKPARAPKKTTGHEAFLNALEGSKAMIGLTDLDGFFYVGRIKASDKFTISLAVESVTEPDMLYPEQAEPVERPMTRVFFKHALHSFEPLTPRPETDDSEDPDENLSPGLTD